jgi:uncharacterized membrane protein YphA (DoxX/SURF4 family)
MTSRSIELACGWWLAAILGWAAFTKFRDPVATRGSFDGLGLRSPDVLAVAVPITEVAVGVALVLWPPVGGAAAIVLLVAFTVVLVRVVRSGARVPCACFGAAATSPVSWLDVVRNLGLVTLAVLASIPSTRGWPGFLPLVVVNVAIVVSSALLRLARGAPDGPELRRS